jgi:beta-lactamase class A
MIDEGKVRIDQDVSITPDDFVRQGFHSPIRNVNPQGTVMNVYGIMRYSISESDGTASDVLLDLAGGPEAVMNYLKSIGLRKSSLPTAEKSISKDWETQYRNWATPEASIELLRLLHERRAGLSEQMTNLLTGFHDGIPRQADANQARPTRECDDRTQDRNRRDGEGNYRCDERHRNRHYARRQASVDRDLYRGFD